MVTKLRIQTAVTGKSWLYMLFGLICQKNTKKELEKSENKIHFKSFEPGHYKPNLLQKPKWDNAHKNKAQTNKPVRYTNKESWTELNLSWKTDMAAKFWT